MLQGLAIVILPWLIPYCAVVAAPTLKWAGAIAGVVTALCLGYYGQGVIETERILEQHGKLGRFHGMLEGIALWTVPCVWVGFAFRAITLRLKNEGWGIRTVVSVHLVPLLLLTVFLTLLLSR
jgi:hypothetical protein